MTQSIKMLPTPQYLIKRPPASVIKAYENDLPDSRTASTEPKNSSSDWRKKADYQKQRDPPFSAKVKRRWADTKAKVRQRLGMYAYIEPLPIGLYLDMAI